MASTPGSMQGVPVVIVSRCAWTLVNFRRALIGSAMTEGAQVLAVGDGRDGFARRLVESGMKFRHVAVARRGLSPVRDLMLLMQLLLLFVRTRPSVVHCFTIKPAIYGMFAAALARVPVRMVTMTGLGHAFTSASPWLTAIVQMLYRAALSCAHLVQFQNPHDRDLFVRRRLVRRDKTMLVAGSGVDVDKFRVVPLPAASGRPLHFLMVARLIREKGVREFVAAARELQRHHPHVRFSLLGGVDQRNPSGLTREELQAIESSTAVAMLGETDDVRPYLADADVIVLPSYREGLPRALLEAAAMGRPAVACDVPGCREVVVNGVTGYLVPPQDAHSLAIAMQRFIDAPAAVATMGAAARAHVVEHFDERAVVQSTLDQYRRLLAEKASDAHTTVVS